MNKLMKRGLLALATATVLTGATLATASASGTSTTPATTPVSHSGLAKGAAPALRTAAVGAATTATLLLPDSTGSDATTALSYSGGTSVTAGKAGFEALSVTRGVDAKSVFLAQRLTSQKALAKGIALVVTPSGSTQPEMKMTLGGVTVVSDQFSGTNGGIPQEQVSFHYTSVELDYWTPKKAGGYTETTTCWDVSTETASCPTAVK